MTYYTIGDIFRLKLLRNHKGEPYKDKATVSRVLSNVYHVKKKTPFGIAKLFTDKTIRDLNSKWK